MFEREVMVSSLKKQSETLRQLVEEIESQPRRDWQDTEYFHESLKKIESSLKKIRRMDEEVASNAHAGERSKYVAFPMRLRDAW